VHTSKTNFSFFFLSLVQLAVAMQNLREAQATAAGAGRLRPKDCPKIKCPRPIGNLRAAMGLKDNPQRYGYFRVSFFFSYHVYCD
jgi:hypothetical protein